jgi:hypothetical protein
MSADPLAAEPGSSPESPLRPRLLRGHWLVWLFAAVGLLGILCLIALTAMIVAFDRPPRDTARVADEKKEAVFAVGAPEDLPGTSLIHLAVNGGGGGRGGSGPYSGNRDDQRNVLLIDKMTGASRRILPDNQHRILSERFLPQRPKSRTRGATMMTTPLW